MSDIKLLDCTLRDGGYVNNWDFNKEQISSTINNLTKAGLDYIEMGYLTSMYQDVGGSRYQYVEIASNFIPKDRKHSKFLLMADVTQYDTDTLCPRTKNTIDGIRVVFYKRQIEQAVEFCKRVVEHGYDLFLQPMVTIDYSVTEFEELVQYFCNLCHPYALSIVDSFGCMKPEEIATFFKVLDRNLDKNIKIGFHGHDNMQLSLLNVISLFEVASERDIMIDASVSGIGRGAGNLHTELIVHYMNYACLGNYELEYIVHIMSNITEPISRKEQWGYSPYFMLTALKRAHPNFATYLLANYEVTVNEFKTYLSHIPDDMLTKCTRPYVEELYEKFRKQSA